MVSFTTLQKLALALPQTTEEPHFEKTSFRVKGKIFATYEAASRRACLKLSPIDQNVFSLGYKDIIYAVDNKWGLQGWTWIELRKVNKAVLTDALTAAFCTVAPKQLAAAVRPADEE